MKRTGKERVLACLILALLIAQVTGAAGAGDAAAQAKPVLNKKKVSIFAGETTTLTLKNWKKKVTWSSSKKSVATVSGKGVVKAKKKGTVKITAKAGGKKYVCQVSVRKKSNYATQVLDLVNKERTKRGLSKLKLDQKLCQAANKRAKETVKLFDHTRPDGTTCFTVLKEFNISYNAAGENIAFGYPTAKAVVKGWMDSPGHRANILSKDFTTLGVGHVVNGQHYWVQLFTRSSKKNTTSSAPKTKKTPPASPTSKPSASPSATPAQDPGDTSGYPEQVLTIVNAERAKAGLSPLVLDPSLCAAASVRSQEIVGQFSHTRPDGRSCFTILAEYGIGYFAAGENIASGQSTPSAVMTSWMNSSGHRANILSADFHKLGVGYTAASSGYGHYWVQLFTD